MAAVMPSFFTADEQAEIERRIGVRIDLQSEAFGSFLSQGREQVEDPDARLVGDVNAKSETIEQAGIKLTELIEDITAVASNQEAQLRVFEGKAQEQPASLKAAHEAD